MAECREVVENEDPEEIRKLVEAGMLAKVVECLGGDEYEQLDAAYIATALTMPISDFIDATVEHGVIEPLVVLMKSDSDEVVDQALLALSNIVGDSTALRDKVLDSGTIDTLVEIMPGRTMSTAQNGVWFISNLVKIKPLPRLETMSQLVRILREILAIRDPDASSGACWALATITDLSDDSDPDTVSMVISSDILPVVLDAARNPNVDVAIPSLKVIGNGLSGCDGDADTVMAAGVLDTLLAILRGGGDDSLAKEAAWALSNIAAGTEQQLQAMLEKPGLIRQLVAILRSAEHAVATKKECAYALCNATHGEDEQIALLVANDVLRAVKDMLEMDKKMQAIGLEAIRSIILAGETDADEIGYNPYSKLMDALGVFNSVQSLALDVEHSVAVAEIQDTFIDDWISYKEENPDEFALDPEMEKAAVKLQAMARGRKSRKYVEEMKGEKASHDLNAELLGLPPATKKKGLPAMDAVPAGHLPPLPEAAEADVPIGDSEEEQTAAMKIQAIQRGRQARREVRQIRDTHGTITPSQVAVAAASAAAGGDEAEAALKIQALQRGRQARKEVEQIKETREQEEAVVKIQAMQRGRAARNQLKRDESVKRGGHADGEGE